MRPVTHVAEVAVNSASEKEVDRAVLRRKRQDQEDSAQKDDADIHQRQQSDGGQTDFPLHINSLYQLYALYYTTIIFKLAKEKRARDFLFTKTIAVPYHE